MKKRKLLIFLPLLFVSSISCSNGNTFKNLGNRNVTKLNAGETSKVDVLINFSEKPSTFVAKHEPKFPPTATEPYGKIRSVVLEEAPGAIPGLLTSSKKGVDNGMTFRGEGSYASRSKVVLGFEKEQNSDNDWLHIEMAAFEARYQPYFFEQLSDPSMTDLTNTDFIQYRVKNTDSDVAIVNYHIGNMKYDNNQNNLAYLKSVDSKEWTKMEYRVFENAKPGHIADGKGTLTYNCMIIPKNFDGYIRLDASKARTSKFHRFLTFFEAIEGPTDLYIDDIAKVGVNQTTGIDENIYFQKSTAPENLQAISPTSNANNDGKITGVDSTMEYKLEGQTEYISVTGNEITGLIPGKYLVRFKKTETSPASKDAYITINRFIPLTNSIKTLISYEEDPSTFVSKFTTAPSVDAPLGKIGSFVLNEKPGKIPGMLLDTNEGLHGAPIFRNGGQGTLASRSNIKFDNSLKEDNKTVKIDLNGADAYYQMYYFYHAEDQFITDYKDSDYVQIWIKTGENNVRLGSSSFGALKQKAYGSNMISLRDYRDNDWTILEKVDYSNSSETKIAKDANNYVIPANFEGYLRLNIKNLPGHASDEFCMWFIAEKGNTTIYTDDVSKVGREVIGTEEDLFFKSYTPAAPIDLKSIAETSKNAKDGIIENVNETMEYKLSTDEEFKEITTNKLENLVPGTYQIRYKAVSNINASYVANVVVDEYLEPIETVKILMDGNITREERGAHLVENNTFGNKINLCPVVERTGYNNHSKSITLQTSNPYLYNDHSTFGKASEKLVDWTGAEYFQMWIDNPSANYMRFYVTETNVLPVKKEVGDKYLLRDEWSKEWRSEEIISDHYSHDNHWNCFRIPPKFRGFVRLIIDENADLSYIPYIAFWAKAWGSYIDDISIVGNRLPGAIPSSEYFVDIEKPTDKPYLGEEIIFPDEQPVSPEDNDKVTPINPSINKTNQTSTALYVVLGTIGSVSLITLILYLIRRRMNHEKNN